MGQSENSECGSQSRVPYTSTIDLLFVKMGFIQYSSRGIMALGLYMWNANCKLKYRVLKYQGLKSK